MCPVGTIFALHKHGIKVAGCFPLAQPPVPAHRRAGQGRAGAPTTTLSDLTGGSAIFYDTYVKVTKA
jgi:hypothetical protein